MEERYIRVNTNILNKVPGDIVRPGDKNYETFKAWAENKDKHGGEVICEVVPIILIEKDGKTYKAIIIEKIGGQ